MGENPMLSDPDLHHVEKALKSLEFLVVQDIFMTETAELADVVLPASCYAEKDGTQTSTERRVQMWRTAVPPPGDAKVDWQIISELAAKMGYAKQFPYKSAEDIFTEVAGHPVICRNGLCSRRQTRGALPGPAPPRNTREAQSSISASSATRTESVCSTRSSSSRRQNSRMLNTRLCSLPAGVFSTGTPAR